MTFLLLDLFLVDWRFAVASVFLLSLIFAISWHFFLRTDNDLLPPCYNGTWRLPWLGCAIELGKAPLSFIKESTRRYGSVFTLKAAGERLTFLTEQEDFDHFFQSSSVDFQAAVQNSVNKAADISKKSFSKYHTSLHDLVKSRLSTVRLNDLTKTFAEQFKTQLDQRWKENGSGDLNSLVRSVMYVTLLNTVIGKDALPMANEKELNELKHHIGVYVELFEHGSRIPFPKVFLRKWSESKSWLLLQFSYAMEKICAANNQTNSIFGDMKSLLDTENAPKFGLLMMFATVANAVPIAFWTVAFILSSEKAFNEAMREVEEIFGAKSDDVPVVLSDLERLPSIKRCVLETIRLRSPGAIARRVLKSFSIRSFVIPKGDLLLLSPYWAHRNPKYFPEPETFNPDRWKSVDLERNLYLDGFVAFGGGRYMCPGRFFVLMEIQLFVALLIHSYDIKLLQPLPKESPLHLVGVQEPLQTLMISYKKKQ